MAKDETGKGGLNPLEKGIKAHLDHVAAPAAGMLGYVPGLGTAVKAVAKSGVAVMQAQLETKERGGSAAEGLSSGASAGLRAAVDSLPGMGVAKALGITGGDKVDTASSGIPAGASGKKGVEKS